MHGRQHVKQSTLYIYVLKFTEEVLVYVHPCSQSKYGTHWNFVWMLLPYLLHLFTTIRCVGGEEIEISLRRHLKLQSQRINIYQMSTCNVLFN